METQFDKLAGSYDNDLKESLGGFAGKDIDRFAEYKVKALKSKLSASQTLGNILEFGCGTGRNIFFMKKYFGESNICGCDVSAKSLEAAKGMNPDIRYDMITEPDGLIRAYKDPFNCIFISNVFHHIPFHEHKLWIDALRRTLAAGGAIFIFEHNPYNPLTRRVFNNSLIDKGATMLKPRYCRRLLRDAGFNEVKLEYTLFFLWRNSFFETAEQALRFLPLGAQYIVWGCK